MGRIKQSVREFLSFDRDIIRYMAMHWVGGSLLIYSDILPAFMDKMGIDVLKAGAIFSVAALFDIVLTFVLSKYLDKISPNVGMAIDWFTESWPALIYGFASANFHFMLGAISRRITNVLNPTYKMYENEIFPEEKRSVIYTYHLMTPQLFTLVLYPVVGYLLTYKFTSILAFRVVFWVCGIGYLFVALIPWKGLRWVEPIKLTHEKSAIHFSKELYLTALAQILVSIGLSFASILITSYYILDKMNGTVMNIMLLQVISAVTIIVTGLFSKDLYRWFSTEKIAQYGILFFIVFSLLMIVAKSYWVILLANLFLAIGDTIWFPQHYSLLMKYVPKEKRGEFFGSLDSIGKLLAIITPFVSGYLANKYGFFVPFTLALVTFAGVCVVYQILLRKEPVVR